MSEDNKVIQRNTYLDVIKGVAIIFVIFAHCIQFGSGGSYYACRQYFCDPVFMLIYGFHMPLFMAVSGFLFWDSVNRHTSRQVVISKIKSLLVPIISWQSLYLLSILLLGQISLSVTLAYSYRGALWFLWSVLICSFLMLIGRIYLKDSLVYGFSVWVLLLFVPDHYLSNLHVFMFPYFMTGYYWKRYSLHDRYKQLPRRSKLVMCGIAFMAYMLFYVFYDNPDKSIYINGTCLLERGSFTMQLFIDMARYSYGFLGISMVMILIDQLLPLLQKHHVVLNCMVELGKMSLGIYAINHYTYEWMLLLPISSNYVYFLTIVETVFTMVLICFVIKLMEKNRYLSLLLLGKS